MSIFVSQSNSSLFSTTWWVKYKLISSHWVTISKSFRIPSSTWWEKDELTILPFVTISEPFRIPSPPWWVKYELTFLLWVTTSESLMIPSPPWWEKYELTFLPWVTISKPVIRLFNLNKDNENLFQMLKITSISNLFSWKIQKLIRKKL